jgi:hypothetical protein
MARSTDTTSSRLQHGEQEPHRASLQSNPNRPWRSFAPGEPEPGSIESRTTVDSTLAAVSCNKVTVCPGVAETPPAAHLYQCPSVPSSSSSSSPPLNCNSCASKRQFFSSSSSAAAVSAGLVGKEERRGAQISGWLARLGLRLPSISASVHASAVLYAAAALLLLGTALLLLSRPGSGRHFSFSVAGCSQFISFTNMRWSLLSSLLVCNGAVNAAPKPSPQWESMFGLGSGPLSFPKGLPGFQLPKGISGLLNAAPRYPLGPDADGKYTIAADGIRMQFIPYGASITNLFINDTSGRERDIVLGFDNATYYPTDQSHPHLGGVPGKSNSSMAFFALLLNATRHCQWVRLRVKHQANKRRTICKSHQE